MLNRLILFMLAIFLFFFQSIQSDNSYIECHLVNSFLSSLILPSLIILSHLLNYSYASCSIAILYYMRLYLGQNILILFYYSIKNSLHPSISLCSANFSLISPLSIAYFYIAIFQLILLQSLL
jgi:hypothetical protein